MNFMHNMVFRLLDPLHEGLYRVVVDDPASMQTILVCLDRPVGKEFAHGGRTRVDNPARSGLKPALPLIGKLHWFDREELMECERKSGLILVEIEPDATLLARTNDDEQNEKFLKRVKVMEEFLVIESLRDRILVDRGVGGLVRRATTAHGVSRSQVYKLFSLLCRFGFSEISLHPRYDRCGAPGVPRPCDPNGRKKAGAKATKQRIAREYGEVLAPDQPGMTTEWRQRILAADLTIKAPKPSMSDRITRIITKAFVTNYQQGGDGNLIPSALEQGEYPNRAQIRYVLETEFQKLERRRQKTTASHYQRAMRGLVGRSWQGVSGPGHTWAMDSTIGDIYLRSSINRNWIIGRPVVYIVVDVWSTAIMGFYVCLSGPSWDMAKIALFSSVAGTELLGKLWGYEPILSLCPEPTLCMHLLCDRGEYLSRAASATGMKLLPGLSYTPPYRPDMKGIVEVLHRIEKDKQFNFLPGAIDYRRKEFDLRRYAPSLGALTVAEFTHCLHLIFAEYNLTANRDHRLDAHMRAAGVDPTPAGLWSWGHQMGIAVQRAMPQSELISTLLPSSVATISRNGVEFGGKVFESEAVRKREWTAIARNFGSYKIPCNYFPGSVSSIWTPNVGDRGLLSLQLSEQSTASPELTWDEVADAEMYYKIGRANREHKQTQQATEIFRKLSKVIKHAQEQAKEADLRNTEPRPSMTGARALEKVANELSNLIEGDSAGGAPENQDCQDQSSAEGHVEMMRLILENMEVAK